MHLDIDVDMTKPSQVIFSHVTFMNSTPIQWGLYKESLPEEENQMLGRLNECNTETSFVVSGADAASLQTLGSSEPITLMCNVNLYAKVY